ncbi:uncharacterized protein K460DRAFT_386343 [Cucurbitaria berberidis CBS 394.84]|uniref:Uncharacterized protein n=1 Tax=Cucurbitaria berberidis CBS 394.84 TaxID=1168544 RepID=A0A9P4GH07_9PLEO|nr:uncharacterized protein K460DRAFT_386343 [Cucurbitaria berberidis CBS 394.84]KAF1845953.1 hypothetical protein K460DRAFT_386343 [Cucurbitaria berberidis CBS 394.84]
MQPTRATTSHPSQPKAHAQSLSSDKMGSWNPFSTSPSRRSSSYRPGYASSSYSSSSRHHSSTSRYKRSPRDSYMQHLYKKLQHFIREIYRYAQRHPYKVFFMVIMPLVSGGVLHKLAKQFGVNLPEMGGSGARGGYAGGGHTGGGHSSSYYGSEGYGLDSRGGGSGAAGGGMMGGLGNIDLQSVAGGIGSLATLATMASKFM